MPYVNKPRPYKKEYDQYHGTEEQKTNRAQRNAARAKLLRSGAVKKGDGKDVHHNTPISKGGTNKGSNLVAQNKSDNRSFARNSDRSVKSRGRSKKS